MGFGPPRIRHPDLLSTDIVLQPDLETPDAVDVVALPNVAGRLTHWRSLGADSPGRAWISHPEQVGVLMPVVSRATYSTWFRNKWEGRSKELTADQRVLNRAFTHTTNRSNLQLQY